MQASSRGALAGEQGDEHGIPQPFRALDDGAGPVLHGVCPTAATFMVEAGVSTETLRTNLGWKSRDVVERYVKAFERSRNPAIEAVADTLP